MFLLYVASGCVLLGILRMVWAKRNMLYGRPVGPISLPFTPSSSDFLSGYATPSSSRPTSPLPFHRDTRRRSSSSPQTHAGAAGGKLFWVPMFLSADGSADKSTAQDPSKWQSVAFDTSSNSWQAAPRSTNIDPDRASLHSMHTIKAVPRRRLSLSSVSSNAGAQTTDYSSSEDDTESRGLLARRRRQRGPHSSSALPPSYSNLFTNWATSLFRQQQPPSATITTSAPTPDESIQKPFLEPTSSDNRLPGSSSLFLSPSRPESTPPALSRQSSTYSTAPPAYPDDAPSGMDVSAVDQILNEMDPQRR